MPKVRELIRSSDPHAKGFLQGFASVPPPRFAPCATRWNLDRVQGWAQFFEIARRVIQGGPALRIILDGGAPSVLNELKDVLNTVVLAAPNVVYRWIQPACRKVGTLGPRETKGWPGSEAFTMVPAQSPAVFSGLKDVVIFLPPNDLPERNRRLEDYVDGAWIAVVYEREPGEQDKLSGEVLSYIEARAKKQKHSPWLFLADKSGKLTYNPDQVQYGVAPFPEPMRHLLR